MLVAETVIATCAALSLVGAMLLWVVYIIVRNGVHDGVNGFATRITVVEQRIAALESADREGGERLAKAIDEVSEYAHSQVHEIRNQMVKIQIEALKEGKEIGRRQRKEEA